MCLLQFVSPKANWGLATSAWWVTLSKLILGCKQCEPLNTVLVALSKQVKNLPSGCKECELSSRGELQLISFGIG